MKKSLSSSIIPKIFLFLCLGAVLALLLFYFLTRDQAETVLEEKSDQEDILTEVVLSIIPELKDRWTLGDKEGTYTENKWKCEKLIPNSMNVDSTYFECNPDYLSCVFQGAIPGVKSQYNVKVANKNYQVMVKVKEVVSKGQLLHPVLPALGLKLELSVANFDDFSFAIVLEDTCRQLFLPQRLYRYKIPTQVTEKKSLIWDNFNRNIFIDRFLVSNRDIKDWALSSDDKEIPYHRNPKDWPQPATNISPKLQRAYCDWRGSKVLETHFYHAAIFMPQDMSHAMGVGSILSETSWEREKRKTMFAKNPKDLTEADCEQAYVKDCKYKEKYFSTDSSSWSGIYQIMGGVGERTRNPFNPAFQFKTSTKEEPVYSTAHLLGELTSLRNTAGFRCFREIEK